MPVIFHSIQELVCLLSPSQLEIALFLYVSIFNKDSFSVSEFAKHTIEFHFDV